MHLSPRPYTQSPFCLPGKTGPAPAQSETLFTGIINTNEHITSTITLDQFIGFGQNAELISKILFTVNKFQKPQITGLLTGAMLKSKSGEGALRHHVTSLLEQTA